MKQFLLQQDGDGRESTLRERESEKEIGPTETDQRGINLREKTVREIEKERETESF